MRGLSLAGAAFAALLLTACKKDKDDPAPPPAPVITTIVPTQGPTTGGTTVTITGTGVSITDSVRFGGTAGTIVSVPDDTTVIATTPPGAAGLADVTLTAGAWGYSTTETGGFQYIAGAPPAPTVSAVSPAFGLDLGGQTITITGAGFQPGATVQLGSGNATGVVVHGAARITAVTPPGTPGPVTVTVTNTDLQFGQLASGFLYISPNAQTAQFTFDTAAGIDCYRRWFVNFNHRAFYKDLQNLGLQSWGTPGDSTTPPVTLPAVDQLALDWVRAYALATLNVCYGRNTDGSAVSLSSINCTFVGLPPSTGAAGCGVASIDWGMVCVGGCDPGGNGGPHPSASQTACTLGALGAMAYDNVFGTACNTFAECGCDTTYHQSGCQTPGTGIFASIIVNTWGATLGGGQLNANDVQYLDGTVTSGVRYNQLHGFMQQFGHRLAFILAHEVGHALGLVGSNASGSCQISSGLCNSQLSSAHNDCCGLNLMQSAATFLAPPTLSATSAEFSGKPGSAVATGCNLGGASSWTNLLNYVGVSP